MFAGMSYAKVCPVMLKHRLVEIEEQTPLCVERRIAHRLTGGEKARELPREPRPALRAASDHHGIRTGRAQCCDRIIAAADIAVDDHRDGDRLLDGAHRRPIGATVVELTARAAVDSDHAYAL